MNLREVREAAEKLHDWLCEGSEYIKYKDSHPWDVGGLDVEDAEEMMIANYILATIDPEPEAEITAEWLREEWGFEQQDSEDQELYRIIPGVTYSMLQNHDDISWTFYLDSDSGDSWPHDLHTRQQFCDLARCLGIPRRKDGAK